MVAADTGWPLDRVVRYAEPPLGERLYVATLAQQSKIHNARGGQTLIDCVVDQLGVPPEAIDWDSVLTQNQWVVTATLKNNGEQATWTYDPTGKRVHPVSDTARSWMGVQPVRPTEQVNSPSTSESQTIIIEMSTDSIEQDSELPSVTRTALKAVPEIIEVDESISAEPAEPPSKAAPETRSPQPPTKKSRRARAKVPSWDEILFGTPDSE